MSELDFSLQPFPSNTAPPLIEITGNISRPSNSLTICYVLAGDLGELVVSDFSDTQIRKSGLWEQTCFEFFLAAKNSKQYWEFNLSPSGHWNVYRFADYRQGMEEETAFVSLPFKIRYRPDSVLLELEVRLDKIVRADQCLGVGISAVIEQTGGAKTYWALTHCCPRADFHCRESFIFTL